jgi:hypothetical protein
LNWLENALYGIKGIVTDSVTGLPLPAVVTVLDHDIDSARVFTDPDVGDYHRMIEAGTWDLMFSSPGYVSKIVNGVAAVDSTVTYLDVQLAPLTDDPVLTVYDDDIGLVDPGDDVSFYLTLINNGGGNGVNVTAALSTSDLYVTVTQDNSAYPTILAEGGTGISLSAYQFLVSSSCPGMHEVTFQVDIFADGTPHATDYFTIVVGLPAEDFESGDFASYPWEMGGSADWLITSGGVLGGTYCASSGVITHNQSSEMAVTLDVTAAGEISFYHRVSSESGWDYLRFYIDDSQKGEWSGYTAWTQASYPVTVGEHTFKWTYEKDGSQSHGSDRGWIDFVVFPAFAQALTIITDSLPNWTVDHYYSQQLEAQGGSGILTWSDLNGDLAGTGLALAGDGLLSGTPTATGVISFIAHVADDGGGLADQPLSFTISPHVAITTESMPDGAMGAVYVYQLQATGGTGARTWSDRDNDLAAFGLSLLPTTGLISGTATASDSVTFTAIVTDVVGDSATKELSFYIVPDFLCGDADGSGVVNVSDAVYLISNIFGSGPPPQPLMAGDADCDEIISVSDAVYLIGFIFAGGPEPCAECK